MAFDLQNNTVVLQYREVLHSAFQLQENNLWTSSPFPTLHYLRFKKKKIQDRTGIKHDKP